MRRTTRTRHISPIPPVITVDKRRTLDVDLNAFSLDSVKRAAYRFTDKFAIDLCVDGPIATCTFIFDSARTEDWIDRTLAAFRKELLDQELRAAIREETKDVRNLILAHAFSRSGLIGDDSVPAP
jgi:His-Xaa-Ser system protein HxsD